MKFVYTAREYNELLELAKSLKSELMKLRIENEKLKNEIERNDKDIRCITAALIGSDIDYPNGKGGNADNTGVTEDIDFSDF